MILKEMAVHYILMVLIEIFISGELYVLYKYIIIYSYYIKAQGELTLLDLGTNANKLEDVDDVSYPLSLPTRLYFGSSSYTKAYVCVCTYVY